MKNKQTAVEWLMEQWEENPTSLWYADFDKAKAMEKEQITKAYNSAIPFKFGKEYYNETYGKGNAHLSAHTD
jgi:hypothetical protein